MAHMAPWPLAVKPETSDGLAGLISNEVNKPSVGTGGYWASDSIGKSAVAIVVGHVAVSTVISVDWGSRTGSDS